MVEREHDVITEHLFDVPEMPNASRAPTKPSPVSGPGRPAVRPSVTDPEAIEKVCDRLIAGMGMREACAPLDCPAECSVYARMAKDAEFAGIIARAREAQQHAIIDQTVDMADAATPEDWQVVKLRIWARQWRASKLAPKVYGERIDANISGALSLSALVAQSFKLDAPAPALTIEGRAEDETDT
jgi:hypothetical protein